MGQYRVYRVTYACSPMNKAGVILGKKRGGDVHSIFIKKILNDVTPYHRKCSNKYSGLY